MSWVSDYNWTTRIEIRNGPSAEELVVAHLEKKPIELELWIIDHAADDEDPDYEQSLGPYGIVPLTAPQDDGDCHPGAKTFEGPVVSGGGLFNHGGFWYQDRYVAYVKAHYYEDGQGLLDVSTCD